jgi:hypothetical protein
MSAAELTPEPGEAMPKEQRRFTGLIKDLVPAPLGLATYRVRPAEFNGLRPYDQVVTEILRADKRLATLQFNLGLFSTYETNPAYQTSLEKRSSLEPIHFQSLSLYIDDDLIGPGIFKLIAANGQVFDEYNNATHVNEVVTDVRMQKNRLELISPLPAPNLGS